MIIEQAYAKLNLALDVLDKREDGFHEVNNLMIPIELHDTVYLEKTDKGIELIDSTKIKREDNFCYKAAKLFFETYKIKQGVKIELKKRIPTEAGLAGGSSDASAVLRGLNRLFSLNLSANELEILSEKLGSDMPYCINQKLSLCTGRGEKVQVLNNINYKTYDVLLIKPDFGLSTKEIYENYVSTNINKKDRILDIISDLETDNLRKLEKDIFNDLITPAIKINKKLNIIIKKIKEENISVFMSGSGPTLFMFNLSEYKVKRLEDKFRNALFFRTKLKI